MDSLTFIRNYFTRCDPDQYIELVAIHPDRERFKQIIVEFIQVKDIAGLINALDRLSVLNRQGYGVYYGVCPRATLPLTGKRGSEDHVDTIVGFWTELDSVKEGRNPTDDLNKLRALAMPPSLCVLSGGGVHAYWLLTEPVRLTDDNRALVKSALRGLGKSVGGDTQVAEFARVLRVPGFTNTKPGRDNVVAEAVLPAEKHRYQLEQLIVYAPPPEPERKPRPPIDHVAPHGEKVDTARAALDAVSPSRRDNYEDWYQVGMTLQELGSDGLYLWDAWSAGSDKYKPGECQRKWDSFRGSGLTLASLYHMADQDGGTGWRPLKVYLTPAPPIIVSNDSGKPSHLLSGERGALYRNTDRVTAILIDAAANAGPSFDIPYLVCCAEFHGISASAVYKAVNRLSVVFLHCGAYIEDSTIQENLDHGKDSICATVEECLTDLEARRVGRPATMYKLADRATLHAWILKQAIPKIVKETFTKKLGIAAPVQVAFLEELGLDEFEAAAKAKELERLHGRALSEQPGARQAMQDVRKRVRTLKAQLASSPDAPIPAGVLLDNRPKMLAAALRALMGVLGKAFQITQEKLCGLIGCRKNELASVCRAVGLVVDHHVYEDRPAVNYPSLMAIPRQYDHEIGGWPERAISATDKRGMKLNSPTFERWAFKQFRQMNPVLTVRYRLANRYRLAEPEPVTEPIETPEPPKVLAVQPELIPVEHAAPFVPWLRALVVFRFAANLLNALVMAWSVAKEAAWHLRQNTTKAVPYAVNWLRKVVDAVTPWQPVGADLVDATTGEKQVFSVQLGFDLLLETKLPEESLELPPGVGSMENTEPCRSLPSKSSGSTIGIGSAHAPPTTIPALAISLSP